MLSVEDTQSFAIAMGQKRDIKKVMFSFSLRLIIQMFIKQIFQGLSQSHLAENHLVQGIQWQTHNQHLLSRK